MAGAGDPRWRIEVPFDPRLFLEVPVEVRGRGDITDWVRQTIAEMNVRAEWKDDPAGLADRLEGQVRLMAPEAFAALLFCPYGLPGDILVHVFITDSDAASLVEVPLDEEVSLPQRVAEISSPRLGVGRTVSSAASAPDGTVIGQLRCQFLSDGVLVELSALSTDLSMLGAALPLLEDIAGGVLIERDEAAS